MNRRDLLKFTALGGIGASVLSPSPAQAAPNSPFIIMPFYDDDPLTLANEDRHILIIGGGLAGMSAALELAERGYKVTLREAQNVLGGRLATRSIDTNAGTFQVEHGLHMWFHNYHNFKDIRQQN